MASFPLWCRALLLVCALGLASGCATQRVGTLPTPSASLSDQEVVDRLAFLEERLEASRRHASLWHWGWLTASAGGVVVGSVQAALADESGDRAAGIATAVLAVGGIGYLGMLPMDARLGADPVRTLPDDTRAQRLARLDHAQETLLANARRATVQRDWVTHVANAAVSLAAGGIVYAVGDDATPAITTTVAALVGGEVQFWTEPYEPFRDVEAYRKRFGMGGPQNAQLRVVPTHRGLALRLDF